MFDFTRTLSLIKGALFDPETTWNDYLPEAGDWIKTATLLTGPLVVVSGVLAWIVDRIFPNTVVFIPEPSFLMMLIGIVVAAAGAVIVAFVFGFLAGLFKGKNSFPLALAATSLAFVPGYIGNIFGKIPWIGWLVSLGLGIYGLVLLWRILPKYLEVPDASRVGHYILSLLASIIIFFLITTILGVGYFGANTSGFTAPNPNVRLDERSSGSSDTGFFGGMERQGRLIEAAQQDTYDPPGNGKISRDQIEQFISNMAKTRDYQQEQVEKLERLNEKVENDQSASLSEAFSGMSGVVGMASAEMEVVKTGGGNWAEHMWVQEQLHIARIQRDINEAVQHNYNLYLEFQEELQNVGF